MRNPIVRLITLRGTTCFMFTFDHPIFGSEAHAQIFCSFRKWGPRWFVREKCQKWMMNRGTPMDGTPPKKRHCTASLFFANARIGPRPQVSALMVCEAHERLGDIEDCGLGVISWCR